MTDNDHSGLFKASVEKQLRANQAAEAEYQKYLSESRRPTPQEVAAAEKARLYFDHKIRGSLEAYYDLYPEDRPKARSRDGGDRER